MHTYRELFRTPEFAPLFWVGAAQVAGQTVSGLALATLVYGRTGSPLLSALAMFGPSLAQLVGATTLLSAADRLAPRAALAGMGLLFALIGAAQALALPVATVFALLFVQGVVASLGGGVRFGLLNEIVRRDGYLLGRSVVNSASGAMQIAGFAVGGAMVAVASPQGALLIGALLYLVSAVVARFGLSRRAARATGKASIGATMRVNRVLLADRPRRTVFLAMWLPNGLVVGCESLYVAYEPRWAGLLFAAGAVGMLMGDALVARLVPRRIRRRLPVPLLLLLAVPFLAFAFDLSPAPALLVALIAPAGFAATLLLQERLMALTPESMSGHALGLHSSGMLAMQGVAAALAGAVAELWSPGTAIAVSAALSVAATLALAGPLRATSRAAFGDDGAGTLPGSDGRVDGPDQPGVAVLPEDQR